MLRSYLYYILIITIIYICLYRSDSAQTSFEQLLEDQNTKVAVKNHIRLALLGEAKIEEALKYFEHLKELLTPSCFDEVSCLFIRMFSRTDFLYPPGSKK